MTNEERAARDDGGPAFPRRMFTAYPHGGGQWTIEDGMSLRDWFAGQALAGVLANAKVDASNEKLAAASYLMADAMLAARAKEPSA